MFALSALIKPAAFTFVGIILYLVYQPAVRLISLSHLQGPPHNGAIVGNIKDEYDDERGELNVKWIEKYGKVHATWGIFGNKEVYISDLKAIGHILNKSDLYQKPVVTRYLLGRFAGKGLLVTETDEHRKQRKIMDPAFGPAQVRPLTGIFVDKSVALRDIWATQIDPNTSRARIDVLSWLSRTTMDIIGIAGFGYELDALSGKPNELTQAFAHIFESGGFFTIPLLLKILIPVLRSLPEHDAKFRRAQDTTGRIGKELLTQSQLAARSEKPGDRDLLSLLIKSNMSTDIPANQRMSDDDVLAQVPTFLAAGHETTSTSTTWALYLLATHPDIQTKLRQEVASVPNESPSMEDLNAFPYLDAVIRETLRLLAPVGTTVRQAMNDDVIPMGEPFTDKYGRKQYELRIKKGQVIDIPILAINKDKSLWGADAEEFKPERWSNLPEAVNAIPGVWGNILTFLGGNHACIGWRFSIVEMKALLFTLVRAYHFELAVPREDILIKKGRLVPQSVGNVMSSSITEIKYSGQKRQHSLPTGTSGRQITVLPVRKRT